MKKKNISRHPKAKIRHSTFGWHCLVCKSDSWWSQQNVSVISLKLSNYTFSVLWGSIQDNCGGFLGHSFLYKTPLPSWRFDHWFSIEAEKPMEFCRLVGVYFSLPKSCKKKRKNTQKWQLESHLFLLLLMKVATTTLALKLCMTLIDHQKSTLLREQIPFSPW